MTTNRRYAIPVEDSTWAVRNAFDTVFRWEYEEGRAALMNLYEKGKKLQWNTNARIDWSQDLDPENPQELPDESVSIFGSPMWERLTRQEKATLPPAREVRPRLPDHADAQASARRRPQRLALGHDLPRHA